MGPLQVGAIEQETLLYVDDVLVEQSAVFFLLCLLLFEIKLFIRESNRFYVLSLELLARQDPPHLLLDLLWI